MKVLKKSKKKRQSKRQKVLKEKKLPAEKDAILKSGQSAGTKIKHHAQDLYFGNQYHKLDNNKKDSISNGFNSILDLTNNSLNGQRCLFSKEEWENFNAKWNKQKNWDRIDEDVRTKLKTIEDLAVSDVRKAYVKTLTSQTRYALTENEVYFEVYAFMLKTLQKKKKILNSSSNDKFTEADYIINVWSRIFQLVFDDHANSLFCKWGDSVLKDSSNSKKNSQQGDGVMIGDKIDLRICTQSSRGTAVDLACVEFAKNNRDDKFYSDHRKTLREGKTVADQFYRFLGLKSREKRNIAGCCIQIAAVEGRVMNVKLVDQGLYVASYLGSLRLPTSQVEMKKTRVLLERLFTLKRNLLYLKNLLQKLEFDKSSESKSMDRKLNTQRSPYEHSSNEQSSSDETSNEELSEEEISEEEASEEDAPREITSGVHKGTNYTNWVRGSWFPPPPKKDLRYDGVWHKYLFSPPPLL